MPRTAKSTPLLLFLLCLPLAGCAAGYGNYGPGGLTDRIGERSDVSGPYTGSYGKQYVTVTRWKEHSSWRGALAFGLSVGKDDVSLTGMRDSTIERSKYLHSDVVFNIANDRASLGGTIGYFSTKFTGSPTKLDYSGITIGPMVFLRIAPFISVNGTIAKVFGSVKDADGYYYKPVYNFLDEKQALAGWRKEAYVNIIPIRTEQLDLGVRLGYQQTESEEKVVFFQKRKYKSSGPMVELLAFVF